MVTGPVVYIDPNNNPSRIATLIGIISWNGACGYAAWPDVHGRVTKILGWIKSVTGKINLIIRDHYVAKKLNTFLSEIIRINTFYDA